MRGGVGTLKKLGRLYGLYAKLDLEWLTQDTRNCLITMLGDVISNLAGVASVFLLSRRFGGVGGLNSDQVLWMLGFFGIGDGLQVLMCMGNNVGWISRRVGRGQTDHMLIQPLPLWMQLATEGFLPISGVGCFLTGIGVTAFATVRLGLTVTPVWLGMLVLYVLCRVAVTMGLSYIAGACAFWRPAACEEFSSLMIDLFTETGKYPLSGLGTAATVAFTTLIPVGLAAWLPSMVLLGQFQSGLARIWPIVAAVAFGASGAVLFRKGLKQYAKVGSARYSAMGHRR